MRIMSFSSLSWRWLVLLAACLCSLGALPGGAEAAETSLPGTALGGGTIAAAITPAALFGGIMDSVVGDRSRMVRFAFIGFAIGVAILMTATRKH
jgi:hypothetical protein